MRFSLSIVMVFVCAFSGYSVKPQRLVYVKDCNQRFQAIYADRELRNPLPNPFVSGRDGQFTFFTDSDCIRVMANPWHLWEEVRFGRVE